jgi:hypothetical protein
MNAEPFLAEIGRALGRVHLDAVMIGNAAAALEGRASHHRGIRLLLSDVSAQSREAEDTLEDPASDGAAAVLSGLRPLSRRS